MTFSKFSSLSLVFPTLLPSPSPCFPLTLPLMVIYLVGKGFAFSPERTTTGRQQKKKKENERKSRKKEWAQMVEKNGNIYHWCRSPRWHWLSPPTLPHSCNGSEGLAKDSEGREKRITCQYLFPLAAWIETDTLHSLSLFSPKANSRALPLFGIKRTSGRRLGESRHSQIVNEDTTERYEFGERKRREWLTKTNSDFYGPRMGIRGEWTFPIANLWKANNESKHCPGLLLLCLIDYRLHHQYEQLLLSETQAVPYLEIALAKQINTTKDRNVLLHGLLGLLHFEINSKANITHAFCFLQSQPQQERIFVIFVFLRSKITILSSPVRCDLKAEAHRCLKLVQPRKPADCCLLLRISENTSLLPKTSRTD